MEIKLIEAGALALAKHTGRDTPSAHQRELARIVVAGIVAAHKNIKPAPKPELATSRDPLDGGGNIHEKGPTALGGPPEVLREQSRLSGYTGDPCPSCGNFTMKQVGKCLGCDRCGASSGCS